MSKHFGNMKRLHSKLLARYGVEDALVLQLKAEIDSKKTQCVTDKRWSVSYAEFIRWVFQNSPVIALNA